MFYTTVWTFLRAGKLYITDWRGPSTNVSYFHYRSGLVSCCFADSTCHQPVPQSRQWTTSWMSAHNTGRRLAEKELSAWTRTREPGSPLLVSRSERHTQEEEDQPVMAASSLQELTAMRNLATCELDKRHHLVTDVRTSKRHMD